MNLKDIEITDKMMDDFGKHLDEIKKRDDRNENRIRRYLSRLSDTQIDDTINKFFLWENKFEERKYKNGIQTTSMLFHSFIDYCEYHGKDVTEEFDEPFLSSAFIWGNYTFKTYCGQGCYTRILKQEKEIFQTT